jgi:hypothetical protein
VRYLKDRSFGMNLKSKMIASVAALTLGLATVSTPAFAGHWHGGGGGWHGGGGGWHGGGGGWHGGGGGWHGGGWHGGGWGGGGWGYGGGWGPAIGLGLAAGAIAGGAYYGNCYRNQPIYDTFGNYVGSQPVNVC